MIAWSDAEESSRHFSITLRDWWKFDDDSTVSFTCAG